MVILCCAALKSLHRTVGYPIPCPWISHAKETLFVSSHEEESTKIKKARTEIHGSCIYLVHVIFMFWWKKLCFPRFSLNYSLACLIQTFDNIMKPTGVFF